MTRTDAMGSRLRGAGPLGARYRVMRIGDLGGIGPWHLGQEDHWRIQRWDAWRCEWIDQQVEDERQEDVQRSVESHRESAEDRARLRAMTSTPNPADSSPADSPRSPP